ncbi:AraC family transcriptional regulator [Roseiconus lacunae]|uniref:Substrate-binding domain-containing protein n=1 Tax=Roseiconus lacunae TaxID=2605694 RepID=A0ABT7PBP3_9BACT|nr:xylose operon transcription regulator XylR [Roseiconus lacunae]MDM4013917.1 substrate-binding domain-containing protein [Roseiconus lacunae]
MSKKLKPTRLVGLLVEPDDSWGRNIIESSVRRGLEFGWTTLIAPRDHRGLLRVPKVWRGHGVIAALRNRASLQHVKKLGVPAVNVSGILNNESWLASVRTDDRRRATMAAEHLRSRGIQHFACYAPEIGRYSDIRAREFKAAVEQLGCHCSLYDGAETAGWLTNFDRVGQWLERLPRPLGVFAGAPYPARQLIEICSILGIRVPDEVAVISGDDDDLLCNVAFPQISSVELASHRIGKIAADILQRLMNGGRVPKQAKLVEPLRVRARQSTDIFAIEDETIAAALQFIRAHAAKGASVEDVAKAAAVSRRKLEQLFRETLQRTPGSELRRVRLDRAKDLLLNTDMSIDVIADACSFSSGASLSQLFRKEFGEAPGSYRRNSNHQS